ncbi:MAG: hypothetical protein E6R03_07435 [Hyphomicrobiaceae bacterium]|nr:MAG: hypothetical protein E6R03_07435 [Hyphomicrobiaceae bacterium]
MANASGKGGFQKGKSGNPGGRTAKTEAERTLEQMCRDKTPKALATILNIMADGDSDKVKLSAAQYVIDRGWGKAAQAVVVEGGQKPIQHRLEVAFVGSNATKQQEIAVQYRQSGKKST